MRILTRIINHNKTMKTDPRFGAPSASSFSRFSACSASFRRGREAQERGFAPPAGEDASSGTKIHKWLETLKDEDAECLSVDEKRVADLCLAQANKLITDITEIDHSHQRPEKELRLGVNALGKVEIANEGHVFTGQSDLIVHGRPLMVIDYKTGRGEVEKASENKQLQILGAMACKYFGADSVVCAIVQPLAGPPSASMMSRQQADWVIDKAISDCEFWTSDLQKQAIPGDHCQYCPARTTCPEFADFAQAAPAELAEQAGHNREAFLPVALSMDNSRLAQALRGLKAIGWYVNSIKAAAEIKLKNGEQIDGYELAERVSKREITDPAKASELIAPLLVDANGGSAAAIIRCAKLSAKKLQDEIQIASGRKTATRYNMSATDAKNALSSALGDVLTVNKTLVLKAIGEQLEE